MKKLNIKQNKLPIIIGSLALITLMAIIYAVFTGTLNINGTANVRDSKWDIHIVESGQLEPSNITESARVLTKPTAQSLSISDFNLSLTTPGDYIEYTFHVINDGDYDATLSDLDKAGVVCTANGSTSDPEAVKVCDKLEYTLKYEGGADVAEGDTLLSKETKTMVLKIKYQEFNDPSLLPTTNVSISGLGIDISYTQSGSAKVNEDGTTPYAPPLPAVSELLSKVNSENTQYEQGSEASHHMYTFSHPATEQTEALTDYRYIGKDPYNYVDFNCDDNGENCETWRIIGVFTFKNGSKTEQRIKLVRDEKLDTKMKWDSQRANEWPSATLNTYLNGDYYQSMSNVTKLMIEPAETYLGGRAKDDTTLYGTTPETYAWERGTTRYDSSRSLSDTKNITLLYLSDYTYTYANGVNNKCYSGGGNCGEGKPSTGWLYKSSYNWWLVSPDSGCSNYAFYMTSYGYVNTASVHNALGVRPVVYLTSDILFEAGHSGSSDDHYVLKK